MSIFRDLISTKCMQTDPGKKRTFEKKRKVTEMEAGEVAWR